MDGPNIFINDMKENKETSVISYYTKWRNWRPIVNGQISNQQNRWTLFFFPPGQCIFPTDSESDVSITRKHPAQLSNQIVSGFLKNVLAESDVQKLEGAIATYIF